MIREEEPLYIYFYRNQSQISWVLSVALRTGYINIKTKEQIFVWRDCTFNTTVENWRRSRCTLTEQYISFRCNCVGVLKKTHLRIQRGGALILEKLVIMDIMKRRQWIDKTVAITPPNICEYVMTWNNHKKRERKREGIKKGCTRANKTLWSWQNESFLVNWIPFSSG